MTMDDKSLVELISKELREMDTCAFIDRIVKCLYILLAVVLFPIVVIIAIFKWRVKWEKDR